MWCGDVSACVSVHSAKANQEHGRPIDEERFKPATQVDSQCLALASRKPNPWIESPVKVPSERPPPRPQLSRPRACMSPPDA